MYVCMYVYIYMCVCVCVCVCVYVHANVYVLVFTSKFMCVCVYIYIYTHTHTHMRGPGSLVGIETDYGLDGLGSNPCGDEIFRPSRPVLEPTHPPVKWVLDLSRG